MPALQLQACVRFPGRDGVTSHEFDISVTVTREPGQYSNRNSLVSKPTTVENCASGRWQDMYCWFRSRKQATQRDLYYRLLHPPIFCSTRVRLPPAASTHNTTGHCATSACLLYSVQPMQDVHEAIQDTVSLLRVPRSCLNICCSSRGAVSGLLSIQEHVDGPWIDCRASGYKALPGDCNAILNYCFQTTAQYILMVEKDVSDALRS